MLFKFKKKKIVVDAFTYDKAAYEFFPVSPAKRYIPDWFKKLPLLCEFKKYSDHSNFISIAPTLKGCNGIIDLYKTGFILPTWADIMIQTDNRGNIDIEMAGLGGSDQSPINAYEIHDKVQFGGEENVAFQNLIHCKFASPWMLAQKDNMNFKLCTPSWNHYPQLIPHVVPGIVNGFPNGLTPLNINTFWAKQDARFDISAGTPLAHIIPLSENNVEIKTHLIDSKEWLKKLNLDMANSRWAFSNQRYRMKKEKTKIKKLDKESKCPFGFK